MSPEVAAGGLRWWVTQLVVHTTRSEALGFLTSPTVYTPCQLLMRFLSTVYTISTALDIFFLCCFFFCLFSSLFTPYC